MISQVFRSMLNRDRFRWSLRVIGVVCCLTVICKMEGRGEGTRSFASASLSRVSLLPGAIGWRVSKGPTPPSNAGKRWFSTEHRDVPANQRPGLRFAERDVPANQKPGLRSVKKEEGFKFNEIEFRPFRGFGVEKAGAKEAPGATPAPGAARKPSP